MSLMNECMAEGIAFHFKQWGDWAPGDGVSLTKARLNKAQDGTVMHRVGKKVAGRVLDGSVCDGLPRARTT